MLEPSTEDHLNEVKRLEVCIAETQQHLIEQFESGMLTKGSIRLAMT